MKARKPAWRRRGRRRTCSDGRPACEALEPRQLLTTALSFDSVPRGYVAADFVPGVQAVGDFNGDAIPDLLVSASDATNHTFYLKTLLGNGDGNFHLGGTL